MSKQAQEQTDVPDEYLIDFTKGPDKVDETPDPVEEPKPEDQLPDKYKGKSLTEIVEMHRNAESELGRARNEIGQVRRLADELLGINRAQAPRTEVENPPPRKKLTSDRLLDDPEQAVVEVVRSEAEQRERAQAERMARLEAELLLTKFERKHPNFQSTIADPKFAEWVQKSSLRGSLAQRAYQGDYTAADELLTLFNEAQPPVESKKDPDPADQARKAGLVRPGSSAAAGNTNPNAGKQIWSRAKLMEMRLNNPEEFERLQPEILKAYAEKRVR